MPAGLHRLQAVEGAEVMLPAWYTLRGEVSSAQPREVPTVMWFLEQKGKDLNQVREEEIFSARGWLLGSQWEGWSATGGPGGRFREKQGPPHLLKFCFDLGGFPKIVSFSSFS